MTTPSLHCLTEFASMVKQHPAARFAQLATVSRKGRPAVRTIVIREVLAEAVVFTTDARSEKVLELNGLSSAEMCWYSVESRIQYRLRGVCRTVLKNVQEPALQALRKHLWGALSLASRGTFFGPTPGAPYSEYVAPSEDGAREAPPSFALVLLQLEQVETLRLADTPHQRMRYAKQDSLWIESRLNP
jgi:pyridoxamine 5'-phosphate oxidase